MTISPGLHKPTDPIPRALFKAEFSKVITDLEARFVCAPLVHASSWQSSAAPQAMAEVFCPSVYLHCRGITKLSDYQEAILPNLPWADRHFKEDRVSGDPVNPGETWKTWPYAQSANTHRRPGEIDPQFDHSYAERYWPKFAGSTPDGRLEETPPGSMINRGYRFPYGDLDDLVNALVKDPLTRQAYLPVWFPEDLGAVTMGKRVPCSLGYHFIRRGDQLHLIYPMRSCDFVRHFRDDVYLTIRLLLWVLEQCQLANPSEWGQVTPGKFTMHITSLHMFESDQRALVRRWASA